MYTNVPSVYSDALELRFQHINFPCLNTSPSSAHYALRFCWNNNIDLFPTEITEYHRSWTKKSLQIDTE